MGVPSQLEAFRQSLGQVLESIEGRFALLVVAASVTIRAIAPQVFLSATFLLVVFGYLGSSILNRIRDYQVSTTPK